MFDKQIKSPYRYLLVIPLGVKCIILKTVGVLIFPPGKKGITIVICHLDKHTAIKLSPNTLYLEVLHTNYGTPLPICFISDILEDYILDILRVPVNFRRVELIRA